MKFDKIGLYADEMNLNVNNYKDLNYLIKVDRE